jgi:hypothetical protein
MIKDGQPARNQPDLHKRNEGGRDQQFIGDRIEQGARRGDLLPAAGQVAIEQIGQRRGQKGRQRQVLLVPGRPKN